MREKIFSVLSRQLGIPCVRTKDKKIDKFVLEKVPAKFASHYKLMPLDLKGKTLTVVVTDPLDVHTLDDIKLLLGLEIQPVLGGEKDILEAIKKYYGIGADTIERIMAETTHLAELKLPSAATQDMEELVEDASIIKFVTQIIQQAYYDRATDIHIEPYEDEITIRVALTGHLVFSTIHTNDAAGDVTRLLDMGIEPYLVASSVECLIAQRHLRIPRYERWGTGNGSKSRLS